MYLVLADIEMREGNPDKAVDALLDGIQATPQRIDFLDSLSRMLIENHARTEMGQPDIKQESVDRIGRSLKLTAARLERRLAEADGSAASSTAQPGVSLSLAATQRVVKVLEAMGYPKPNLAFLNGQIAIAQGHWLTARQGFEQARMRSAIGRNL